MCIKAQLHIDDKSDLETVSWFIAETKLGVLAISPESRSLLNEMYHLWNIYDFRFRPSTEPSLILQSNGLTK